MISQIIHYIKMISFNIEFYNIIVKWYFNIPFQLRITINPFKNENNLFQNLNLIKLIPSFN